MTAAVAEARPVRATPAAPSRPPDPRPAASPAKVNPPEAPPSKPSPIHDDEHYEIIDGLRVETPWMGYFEAEVASHLQAEMHLHARRNLLGRVVVEGYFEIGSESQRVRPDIAFVSVGRLSGPAPRVAWLPVVPDLAVEVVSPTNDATAVFEKTQRYLRHGVRMVWVIYPQIPAVEVWTSPRGAVVRYADDVLDGGDVLPGFAVKVSDFCSEAPAEPPAPAAGAAGTVATTSPDTIRP